MADDSFDVENWDASIPVTQKSLILTLREKAYEEFYLEDDGTACGGEVSKHVLTDYYTQATYDGDLIYQLKLEFHVTSSFDYCNDEVVFNCEAPVAVDSSGKMDLSNWDCVPVGQKNVQQDL